MLGAGERKLKRVNKPLLGYYQKLDLKQPPAIVREFRIAGPSETITIEPRTRIHAKILLYLLELLKLEIHYNHKEKC